MKKQNVNIDIVMAVRKIQSYNIMVWAALLIGLDGDDEKIFEEQFNFLQDAGVSVAMIGLLQAIPGTSLYKRLAREHRIKSDETVGIRGLYDQQINSNIVPLNMSEEKLVTGFQALVKKVYDYNYYGSRIIDAIRLSTRPFHKNGRKIGLNELSTIIRIFRYYIDLTDLPKLWMFLRVISATVLYKPHHMETAMIHLVAHKHFKAFYDKVASLPVRKSPRVEKGTAANCFRT